MTARPCLALKSTTPTRERSPEAPFALKRGQGWMPPSPAGQRPGHVGAAEIGGEAVPAGRTLPR